MSRRFFISSSDTGGEKSSKSLQYVQARLQRRVGMMCTRKGCVVETSAFAIARTSRTRVWKKRSARQNHTFSEACDFPKPFGMKLRIPPGRSLYTTLALNLPSILRRRFSLVHGKRNLRLRPPPRAAQNHTCHLPRFSKFQDSTLYRGFTRTRHFLRHNAGHAPAGVRTQGMEVFRRPAQGSSGACPRLVVGPVAQGRAAGGVRHRDGCSCRRRAPRRSPRRPVLARRCNLHPPSSP